MKPLQSKLNEQTSDSDTGDSGGQEAVSGQGVGVENHGVGAFEGLVGDRLPTEVRKEKFKPKGSSITLVGSGRRDGSDIDNSMDLVTFYSFMLHNKP